MDWDNLAKTVYAAAALVILSPEDLKIENPHVSAPSSR
jgi:hypothetical protein